MWNSLHQYRNVLTLPGFASLGQGLMATGMMGSCLGTLFSWTLLCTGLQSNSKREMIQLQSGLIEWCSSSWHSSIHFGSPEYRKENWRDVLRCPLGGRPLSKSDHSKWHKKVLITVKIAKKVLPHDTISPHTNY